MSGTKSNFGQGGAGDTMNSAVTSTVERSCAASVNYKNVQGSCRRSGKYPDPDGVRWWCGLHNPARKQEAKDSDVDEKEVEVVKTTVSVSARPKKASDSTKPRAVAAPVPHKRSVSREALLWTVPVPEDVMEALRAAQAALIEISNTNTVGWDETVPVDNYKVLVAHMSDRAKEAQEKVSSVIRQLNA